MAFSTRVVLRFPRSLVDQPIVSKLIKDYNLDFNILKASVNPKEEGLLVLELKGQRKDFDKAMAYLTEAGVETQPLSRDIRRNEQRCTDCGACVVMCPTAAFVVDEAPQPTSPPDPTPAPPTDTYVMGFGIAILAAVIIIGLVIIMMMRKK